MGFGGSSDEDVEEMELSDESESDYEEGLSSSSDDALITRY